MGMQKNHLIEMVLLYTYSIKYTFWLKKKENDQTLSEFYTKKININGGIMYINRQSTPADNTQKRVWQYIEKEKERYVIHS